MENDNVVEDTPIMNAKIEVLSEKETITTFMDAFKEQVDNGIQKCEKDIKKKIEDEWKQIEEKVETDQHNRNRTIIEQIIKTCENFRSKNEDEFTFFREQFDPD